MLQHLVVDFFPRASDVWIAKNSSYNASQGLFPVYCMRHFVLESMRKVTGWLGTATMMHMD